MSPAAATRTSTASRAISGTSGEVPRSPAGAHRLDADRDLGGLPHLVPQGAALLGGAPDRAQGMDLLLPDVRLPGARHHQCADGHDARPARASTVQQTLNMTT